MNAQRCFASSANFEVVTKITFWTLQGASVTIQQGASVSAVVSGTITVANLSVTTSSPSISASGQVIWIAGGQSTTAFPVVVTGTVSAGAGTTVISGTVSVVSASVLSTIVTILGTQVVTVVPGLSVVALMTPTDRTTAVPSSAATGQIIWVAGGQSTTAFPVVITGTVTAGAGTTV